MKTTLFDNREIDLLDPDPAVITDINIAWPLSNLCRHNGKSAPFFSVAQHSLNVAILVAKLGGNIDERMAGLLHHGTQAIAGEYLPNKLGLCPSLKSVKVKIDEAVMAAFRLPKAIPAIIGDANAAAILLERELLFGEEVNASKELLDGMEIQEAMSPAKSMREFLATLNSLRINRQ